MENLKKKNKATLSLLYLYNRYGDLMNDVYIIVGPTASGKTKLAIELAKQVNGEIINGDAFQVYKELNIGTAKPTPEELKQVKHHLIGYISISEGYDVVTWLQDCNKVIKQLHQQNKPAIVVGGSNLYINGLMYEYDFKDSNVESFDFSNIDNETLHKELESYDVEIANIIHPNNRRRVESYVAQFRSGKKQERNNKQVRSDYNFIVKSTATNYEREELYNRINQRIDLMIDNGLEQEVTNLYKEYDFNNLRSLLAIGYKEWIPFFENNQTKEEVIDRIKTASRNYAKKQLTWIKKWYQEVN